jgi:hypothetical protein
VSAYTIELRGQTLNIEPQCGMAIARECLADGRAKVLVYEPGDMTRYMLIVAPIYPPHGECWLVSHAPEYAPFGDQIGAVVLPIHQSVSAAHIGLLCNGNPHTADVLSAALNALRGIA